MKYFKPTIYLLAFCLMLAFSREAQAATEFISTVMQSGGDYSTLNTWETGVQTDLTSAATQVFSGTKTGTVADNTVVYLCRSGIYQSHSGTTVHATATQILVELISGAATEQSGDIWYTNNTCDSANYFTISDGGDSAIAVAQIDGAWTSADTTAVAIDGWTTDATHYIKIYTTTAARHDGKWNTGKYRLVATNTYENVRVLYIREDFVRVEGLQVHIINNSYPGNWGISAETALDSDVKISDNIVRATLTGSQAGYGIHGFGYEGAVTKVKAWNNIVYDFDYGVSYGIGAQLNTLYAYNNTVYNCARGFQTDEYGTIIIKNNISYNNTDNYSGTFNAASTNNLSGPTQTDAPGSNPRNAATVTFADESGDDFHLALADLGARGYGLSQYADANLPVTDDIDGNSRRPNAEPTDIGADEDIDTLDSVSARISNIQQSGTRYTTLSAWEADRNGNLTGYYPEVAQIDGAWTSADTTAVTISGWTTDATHYIKVYTTAAARHDGKWNTGKYRLEPPSGSNGIKNYENYVRYDGLQIKITTSSVDVGCIEEYATTGAGVIYMSNSILRGVIAVSVYSDGWGDYWANNVLLVKYIWNNIIYDIKVAAETTNLGIYHRIGTLYAYNNTIYNCGRGFRVDGGTVIAKNNISYNNTDNYYGTFGTGSDYNLSGPTQTDAPGSNPRNATTVTFVDAANADFHLALTDLGARGYGLSQYTDANLPVTDDIDGNYRRPNAEPTDIGADEDIDTLDSVSVRISNIQQSGTRYTTLSAWEADRDGDITGYYPEVAQIDGAWTSADTTAVTIDGWTTDATHYIKIYTTAAARHDGKWNTGKYRLEVNEDWGSHAINISEGDVRIDGLQIEYSDSGRTTYSAILINAPDYGLNVRISNNILKKGTKTYAGYGIGTSSNWYVTFKVWNNIIYDFTNSGIICNGGSASYYNYLYNNTIYNSTTGINVTGVVKVVAKNNISYNNTTDYSGTFDSSSTYNLSKDATAPGVATCPTTPTNCYYRSITDLAFVAAGTDFHLALSDLRARGYGLSLYADANLAVTDDIDGNYRRPNGEVTDIGADEDIDTLDGESVRISNIQQSGTRYTTLSAWESDRDGNITGYYPEVAQIDGAWTSADTTAVTIDGWTTDATHYIKIYTTAAARHDGKWNTGKYRLEVTGSIILIYEDYVRIDGLQVATINPIGNENFPIFVSNISATNNDIQISNNILKGHNNASYNQYAIYFGDTDINAKAWNNIIYNFSDSNGRGIFLQVSTAFIYNNTIVGSYMGIRAYAGTLILKNNLIKGVYYIPVDSETGTLAIGTDYNSTDNWRIYTNPPPSGNDHDRISQIFTFVNEAGADFHLASNDAGARNYGTDQVSEIGFSDDIDGETRGGSWDIGADELISTWYKIKGTVKLKGDVKFK